MSELPLGTILEGEHFRDAIHIAIAPVIAGESLKPGDDIGFSAGGADGEVWSDVEKCIGIVDPFIKTKIRKGQRFFMFLYPQTVTGMRHEWQHPAFGSEQVKIAAPVVVDEKAESEKWMREFANRAGLSYGVVIDAAKDNLQSGDYFVQHDTEAARDAIYDCGIPTFWKHFEIITGIKSPPEGEQDSVFSCSC